MLFALLNSCLQSFYKIANINISIWIILLIPVFLGGIWLFHLLHVDKKYNNDKDILEQNSNKYIGRLHDRKSYEFISSYYYWVNELFVTIGAGIFLLLNMESDWSISSWESSKLQITFTSIILLIITKIIIQGFIVSDLVDTFVLISQLLISILLTKRLPLFIFWYTYPVGLIGSFVMFRRYIKLKKNPFEKKNPEQFEHFTAEQVMEAEEKMRQEEMQRSSYRYSSNYSRQHKSEKESLYEMKHPSASSTQMTNMLKFGENRPNG